MEAQVAKEGMGDKVALVKLADLEDKEVVGKGVKHTQMTGLEERGVMLVPEALVAKGGTEETEDVGEG